MRIIKYKLTVQQGYYPSLVRRGYLDKGELAYQLALYSTLDEFKKANDHYRLDYVDSIQSYVATDPNSMGNEELVFITEISPYFNMCVFEGPTGTPSIARKTDFKFSGGNYMSIA